MHSIKKIIIILLFFLGFCTIASAQEQLLTATEIQQNENELIKSFEKFNRKPKRKRLKRKFVLKYEASIKKYNARLNDLYQPNEYVEKKLGRNFKHFTVVTVFK
ncbi:hypothetical protein JL193_10290 [Polaribacter batillariae]|uniref:Uncharacterized protein n=1 Tax=Polaribacter batillariae TaxID=2808900 RepID=A0ABX7SQX5_9FLAO|nr:hypothetical protein [Polaribacter batillariae]QTD36536.1 hypothetical protein JL193_10290 [Polaribacter batillariae]